MSITLGTLDINDQVNFWVDAENVNMGQKQKTWEEVPNYAGGANSQVNVSTGSLVAVHLPMRVKGSSASDLNYQLGRLWTEVDKATNTLVFQSDDAYTIVHSTRPETVLRTHVGQFYAEFELVLMRQG